MQPRKPFRPFPLPFLVILPLLVILPVLYLRLSPAPSPSPAPCDPTSSGRWVPSPAPLSPLYDSTCPFHRHAWNCLRNSHPPAPSLLWSSPSCPVPRLDPAAFLRVLRGRRVGFVGDSLNENFIVAMLCALRAADPGSRRWKKKGAWRGAYFPAFDVVVAYHRAVLLARYRWLPANESIIAMENGFKGIYQVDVDVPAEDWASITQFYDVLVFNTGHWWGLDKFPKETPLVFFKNGKPIVPMLGIREGLQVVLENMVRFIGTNVPRKTIKFWRTQSPRHFHGGEWNQNGSCLFEEPLQESQLDAWFDPRNGGVNREAREINYLIQRAVQGSDIHLLNLTYLSEFRADAHPAIWLGKKDAVAIWGQDCMHWCLPGLPDTWVDILSAQIMHFLGNL